LVEALVGTDFLVALQEALVVVAVEELMAELEPPIRVLLVAMVFHKAVLKAAAAAAELEELEELLYTTMQEMEAQD
jgi:hypothetical protein